MPSNYLNKKDIDIENSVKQALENSDFLSELLDAITSKNDLIRFNCNNILFKLSEENPNILYPHWDYFVELIKSNNNYHKLIALELIANLTKVDIENRFEDIFDEYFKFINSEKTMVAGHLAGISGKIAKNKPNLQNKITNILLNIDNTNKSKQVELIKAYIIDSLSYYFQDIKNKNEIITFVKNQQNSASPKTRHKAKEFLTKYDKY